MANLITTPSHPDADSYATCSEADAYFKNRPNVENWDKLNEDTKEAVLKLATKHIDSLRFFGEKLIDRAMYYRREQALKFPRAIIEKQNGGVDSAGENFIVDASLSNSSYYPDDFFNGGCLIITEGTGKGQTLKVSDFDMATGKVTVSSNFVTTPDSTSRFIITVKIAEKIKNAVFEQCLYVLNGGGERQRMQSEGVVQFSIGDLSERFKESGVDMGKIPVCNEAKGHLTGLYSKIGKIL